MKRRYLALRVESEDTIDRKELSDAIWKATTRLFGEYGASQTGMVLIDYDQPSGQGVLRCSHKALPTVRASIASITDINGRSAAIRVLRISGTLKALHKKLRRR